ncbi:ATP-binding protein [Paenibacillus sp. GCM10027626]|uniref:sensor histidine kinase n=1 Tax=Paenibacillus sp. GCM10027626 TaxID=3273411 RepID=UPI00362850F9
MTIRKRLILSYIAMVLIPVVLFAIIATSLAGVFFDRMTGTGDAMSGTARPLPKLWESFDDREHLLTGIKFMAGYEPDRLLDRKFLQETDEALSSLHAGLVIAKDDRTVYVSPLVDSAGLYDRLKRFKTERSGKWSDKFDGRFTVEKKEIQFTDQSSGTLYLLSDQEPFLSGIRQFFPLVLLSLLIVIGLTNGLLTYLMSRSIIKPLYTLKHAAERIKDGDLDYRLHLAGKDEIGEVGEAFEEMRKRLKQSLQLQMQYEENRKELISNISHDLKTPITGIKACVEGIRDGIANTEEKKDKYIQMIENKAQSMDHLIDELLLFSKLDLKRLPFHYEKFDIVSYLHDYVSELRIDPHMNNVAIYFQEDSGKPVYVMADREKLQRGLINIVDNCMKYMKREDKIIQIWLTIRKQEVAIHIRDNGPGIAVEALPHIFDRFYRAEPSRNTLTGGSGLGLAIVKHIVEEHGGKVWAASSIGEGTTISFTLPVEITEGAGGGHA